MKSVCSLRDWFGMVVALCFVSIFCQTPLCAQAPLDDSFNASVAGTVSSIAIQANGKILLGGNFSSVNGSARSHFARLNSDGSLDTSFSPTNGPAQAVSRVLVRDGKIFVSAGDGLRRYADDGSLEWHYPMNVATFAVDSQGRVFIGGQFTRVDGQYHRSIARLTTNGILDTSFTAAIGCCAGEGVDSLATQGDDVFVGGLFQSVNGGYAVSHFARLGSNGAFDATFAATATPRVAEIALTPDAKVFHANQQTLVRHLANGADDPAFAPVSAGGSSDDRFNALAITSDGKPIVGGDFTLDGGATRTYVARFNADGSRDSSFAIAPNGAVEAIAIQPNGEVLVGGLFTGVNGVAHAGIARVSAGTMPELALTRSETGALVVSWPQSSNSFVLQTTTLNANAWSVVPATPTVANGRNFVTNFALGAGQLFRLRATP
jgi:uncharacterized delta-60 repeat protein